MFGAAAVALCLTGCQARGVLIPPGADELLPCKTAEIPIEDLDNIGVPGCDLVGSSLTFTDGPSAMMIPPVGATFSQGDGSGREFRIVNWGVPGVGVAAVEADRLIDLWASGPEARNLALQQLAIENVDLPD